MNEKLKLLQDGSVTPSGGNADQQKNTRSAVDAICHAVMPPSLPGYYFIGQMEIKQHNQKAQPKQVKIGPFATMSLCNSGGNAQLEQINKTLNEWLSDALEEVSPEDYQEWLSLHQAYAAGIEKCRKGHDLLDRLRPSPGSGHERYEKLKNLSLQQFKEVYVHLLCGKSLNQIVDEL